MSVSTGFRTGNCREIGEFHSGNEKGNDGIRKQIQLEAAQTADQIGGPSKPKQRSSIRKSCEFPVREPTRSGATIP